LNAMEEEGTLGLPSLHNSSKPQMQKHLKYLYYLFTEPEYPPVIF